MTGAPHAPWVLTGESMVGLARWRGPRPPLAPGLAPMPGPFLVAASRYVGAPTGPFTEVLVAAPARLGLRPGWSLVTMAVDVPGACAGLHLNWGMPAHMATLEWTADGDERLLVWRERGFAVRAVPGRVTLPFLVPVRALQRRSDGLVIVPGRLRGRATLARLAIEAAPSDPLAAVAGRHRGVAVAGQKVVLKPARKPYGLLASLVAPLRAPEPALVPNGAPASERAVAAA